MNSKIKLVAGIASVALSCSTLQATQEVLTLDLAVLADFNYDVTGFNAKDYVDSASPSPAPLSDAAFQSLHPVFSDPSDYDVFGFGTFDYNFYNQNIDSSFDLSERYDWTVSINGGWGFQGLQAIPTDPYLAPIGFDDFVSFDFDVKDTSVADMTGGLFGLTPLQLAVEVANALGPIPAAGTFQDILIATGSVPPLVGAMIDPADVSYVSFLDLPAGFAEIALYDTLNLPVGPNGPISLGPIPDTINSLAALHASSAFDIRVTATRKVSDSGTTASLALLGLSLLAVARKRFKR